MINEFSDLGLKEVDTLEDVENKIKEKLDISFSNIIESICKSINDKAEELSHDFVNIAPLGDYSKMIENYDDMAEFLRSECTKVEHWKLTEVLQCQDKPLIEFIFACHAVDDGTTLKGFAFLSMSGKIRHAFAQGES